MPEYTNETPQVVILGAVKDDGSPDIANVLFEFPVPHQSMRIRQEARIDEIEIPGRSGKVKQAVGYEDSDIDIAITLVDIEDDAGEVASSALEQLAELQAAFRDRTKDSLPAIFSIQSPLTDACQIKTVLFRGIEVYDQPGETTLCVHLNFTEFEPVAVQVEKHATQSKARQEAQAAAKQAAEEKLPEDVVGEEDPLADAYRQGKADAMGGPP